MNSYNHPQGPNDLQFMTSVDTSIQQNVQVPQQPPTLNQIPDANIPQNSDESLVSQFMKNSAHPIPALFHILFKALALTVYLLGGVVEHGTNFITVTVICILLLAADFWVVKNITGRLLVGLRWWAQIEGEDGSETRWIFEAAPSETYVTNKFDSTWFWSILYLTPVVWTGYFFANVYGYYHCSKDQKAKFQQMVAKGAEYGAGAAIRHNVFGKMANFTSAFGSSQQPQQTQMNSRGQETTFV